MVAEKSRVMICEANNFIFLCISHRETNKHKQVTIKHQDWILMWHFILDYIANPITEKNAVKSRKVTDAQHI